MLRDAFSPELQMDYHAAVFLATLPQQCSCSSTEISPISNGPPQAL